MASACHEGTCLLGVGQAAGNKTMAGPQDEWFQGIVARKTRDGFVFEWQETVCVLTGSFAAGIFPWHRGFVGHMAALTPVY